jgi:hypothetical protein
MGVVPQKAFFDKLEDRVRLAVVRKYGSKSLKYTARIYIEYRNSRDMASNIIHRVVFNTSHPSFFNRRISWLQR